MTTDIAPIPVDEVDDRRRKAALLKALGLDKAPAEQVELVMAIAKRYELDPLLKHLVLIDGRPFVTRDGLLWIAHRSGVLDGIEVTEDPHIVTLPGLGEFWQARVKVYRKDWSRGVEFPGRYPTKSGNQKYGPEMALKNAESMAYRRAFNVSVATVDEQWDVNAVQADVDTVSAPAQPRTLAERVEERRASVGLPISSRPAGPSPNEMLRQAAGHAEIGGVLLRAAADVDEIAKYAGIPEDEDPEVTQSMGVARLEEKRAAPPTIDDLNDMPECGEEGALGLGTCDELPGHRGPHRSQLGAWPQ